MHSWMETGAINDPAIEQKVMLSRVRREDWWPPPGRHEITFAIHLFDVTLVEYIGPRENADIWKAGYYDKSEWLTGTVDYLGVHQGRPWTDDLKTGNYLVSYKSRQLRSYTLLPWLREGCPDNRLYYRSITQWPRYPLDGAPNRTGLGRPLTSLDLMTHLDDLRYSVEHPNEANPTDEGCKFCECQRDCDDYQNRRFNV